MDPEPGSRSPMLAQSSESVDSGATASASPRLRAEDSGTAIAADPDILLEEIRTHLGEGRYRAAQQLARQAAVRFPGHGGIATMNRGLNGAGRAPGPRKVTADARSSPGCEIPRRPPGANWSPSLAARWWPVPTACPSSWRP